MNLNTNTNYSDSCWWIRRVEMSNELCWLWQGVRRTGAHLCGNALVGAEAMSLRMLVVEDVPIHRLLLSTLLKVLFPNSVVDEAGDGEQAQSMLREQRYDIVLSDWIMPGIDGVQLANWLRSGEVRQLPFVLFSAHDEPDDIASLFSTHTIDGYLFKPFDRSAIREVVSVVAGISMSLA